MPLAVPLALFALTVAPTVESRALLVVDRDWPLGRL